MFLNIKNALFNNISSPNRAFSLFEALITIAVLGILGVFTTTWFMQNFQVYALGKEKTDFEIKISEATRQMNVQQVLSGHLNTTDFVNTFKDYIKIIKICSATELNNCFISNFSTDSNDEIDAVDIADGETLGQDGNTNSTVGLMFLNGANAILSYNPNCEYTSNFDNTVNTNSCLAMIYDINGFGKPNKIGVDITLFGDTELNLSDPYAGMLQLACVNSVGWGLCVSSTMYTDLTDTTTTEYRGTNNGNTGSNYNYYYAANASGTMMSWALAKKTCTDKGKRLPSINEALTLRSANTAGTVTGFVSGGVYWTGTEHTVLTQANNIAITNTSGGNGTKSTLRYVRCISN